jgi:hypothetical protein
MSSDRHVQELSSALGTTAWQPPADLTKATGGQT